MNAPKPTLAILATAVWGLLLLPGLMGAALSSMFFDAPGSMNNPAAWANALVIVSFPVLCILSIAASWPIWIWHKNHPTRLAAGLQAAAAAVPLLPVLYFGGAMAIGIIGIALSGQPLGLHTTIVNQ